MSLNSECAHSVTGDIPYAELGHIQCHEHIWLNSKKSFEANPALRVNDFDRSLAELKRYKRSGGGTIIDAQPGGFGRSLKCLYRLSSESGVNIIAVCGTHKLCYLDHPAVILGKSATELTGQFITELTVGAEYEGGKIRCGLVKLALDMGGICNPAYSEIYRAVAAAAAETGAGVMVHTEKDSKMKELLSFFKNSGVLPEQLLVCHLDRTSVDRDEHRRVMDAGGMLCYDSVYRHKYLSDEQELDLIRCMVSQGYDTRMVLSLDTTNQRLRAYGSQHVGLDSILNEFIPQMRKSGISEASIERMCRTNAAQFLSNPISYRR